jgi:hypothetical protein
MLAHQFLLLVLVIPDAPVENTVVLLVDISNDLLAANAALATERTKTSVRIKAVIFFIMFPFLDINLACIVKRDSLSQCGRYEVVGALFLVVPFSDRMFNS